MARVKYNDITNVSTTLLRHIYARMSEQYRTYQILQSLSVKPHTFDMKIKLLQEDMTILADRIFELSTVEELMRDFSAN